MPWTVDDVDKHNAGLSDEQKKQWVDVANKVLQECLEDGSTQDYCDVKAIKIANLSVNGSESERETKTIDGVEFPRGDFAYTPDGPSTWKLPLTSKPNGPPDPHMVSAAVAALGKGFRGQKVQIPDADLPGVKSKVRSAWRKAFPDKGDEEMPDAIKDKSGRSSMTEGKESRLFEIGKICEAVEETEGLTWKAAFIQAGRSLNGRNYSPEVLEKSVPLFDKAAVYIDHPSRSEEKDRPERSVKDIAGWITNPKWDASYGEGGGIVGSLNLLNSSPASAQIREAYERGNPDLVQLSIYGRIRAVPVRENGGGYWDVKEINKIRSVDLVTQAAAGGRIMDVMHSIREEDDMDMIKEMSLDEILALRPDLVDEFKNKMPNASEDQDTVEGVVQKAVVSAINAILAKAGKVEDVSDEAKKVIGSVRLALGRGDTGIAVRELAKLSKEKSLPEDVRNEIKKLSGDLESDDPANEKKVDNKDEKKDGEDDVKKEADTTSAVEGVRNELESLRNEIKVAECTREAQKKIDATSLPVAMKNKLVAQFSGRVYEAKELDDAINEEKGVYESILSDQPRTQVRVTRDERDKMVDVITATLMGEAYEGANPLGSMHRAYCMFTGRDPYELSRSAIASQIVKESIGFDEGMDVGEAISWTSVFGTAMNRVLAKDYALPVFDDWQLIVSDVRSLSDMRAQYVERIGYYGTLPTVEAGAPYTYATSPEDEEVTYTPAKKGLLEEWTWEQALNDDLGALRRIPKRLALAAKMTLYQFVFDLIDDNPTMTYDSTALFHEDHSNYSVNTLTSDNLTTAKIAMRRQSAMGIDDLRLATKPKYILVPTTLESTALQLINSQFEVTSEKDSTVFNPHQKSLEPIVVDHWTNQTRWYLEADPNIVPTIEIGFLDGKKVPQIFTEAVNSGSSFSADKVVVKIRFVFGGTVVDHRGFYGGRPS